VRLSARADRGLGVTGDHRHAGPLEAAAMCSGTAPDIGTPLMLPVAGRMP
jgi:hypothetical protein